MIAFTLRSSVRRYSLPFVVFVKTVLISNIAGMYFRMNRKSLAIESESEKYFTYFVDIPTIASGRWQIMSGLELHYSQDHLTGFATAIASPRRKTFFSGIAS